MRILLLTFFFLCFSNDVFCQKYVAISELIEIDKDLNVEAGVVKAMLPITIPHKQEVIELKTTPEADSIYEEDGQKFASWNLKKLNVGDLLKIETILLLNRYDLTTAKESQAFKSEGADVQKYLNSELEIRNGNKAIQRHANKLKGDGDIKTTKNIFKFVVKRMSYSGRYNDAGGAIKALRQRRGDAQKYSELMIALCRGNKIPARIIQGKILNALDRAVPHYWVEVYFNEFGWVPFDPRYADIDWRQSGFSKLSTNYIYYSNKIQYVESGWECKGDNFNRKGLEVNVRWKNLLKATYDKAIGHYESCELEKVVPILDSLIATTPLDFRLHMFQGITHARLNNFDRGLKYLQAAMQTAYFEREKLRVFFSFAQYFALKGDHEKAFSYLNGALQGDGGRDFIEVLRLDECIKSLRSDPRFEDILKRYEQ